MPAAKQDTADNSIGPPWARWQTREFEIAPRQAPGSRVWRLAKYRKDWLTPTSPELYPVFTLALFESRPEASRCIRKDVVGIRNQLRGIVELGTGDWPTRINVDVILHLPLGADRGLEAGREVYMPPV